MKMKFVQTGPGGHKLQDIFKKLFPEINLEYTTKDINPDGGLNQEVVNFQRAFLFPFSRQVRSVDGFVPHIGEKVQ